MIYVLAYLTSAYLFWIILSVGIEQDVAYVCEMFSSISHDYKQGDTKRVYKDACGYSKTAWNSHLEWAHTVMVWYSIIVPISFSYVVIYTTTRLLKIFFRFIFSLTKKCATSNNTTSSSSEKTGKPTTF